MATLTLTRFSRSDAGIFSRLFDEEKNILAVTLEHSYGGVAKVGNGTYLCVRGMHRLHPASPEFETFEVTGVPGHSGILFHCGNVQAESSGCLLLGTALDGNRITESRKAFEKFMDHMSGVQEFTLSVS